MQNLFRIAPLNSVGCKRLFPVLLVALFLQSCASPVAKLDTYAGEQGFSRQKLNVGGYELLVYQHKVEESDGTFPVETGKSVLHVYLEGDGSPWRYRTVIMPDPTPRHPLMLKLMARDSKPSIYLGRPCYNGTSKDPGCDNRLWTSGRYSEKVVASMAEGINVLINRWNPDEIRLFGHSGGGALAMLLAEQLPEVTHIVTIAGNLDTDAWTDHHGYTPLFSSLNPAKQYLLRDSVDQWHLVGGRDTVIPPQLVRPFIENQTTATGILFNGYSHGCCWEVIWPQVLQALDDGSTDQLPGEKF